VSNTHRRKVLRQCESVATVCVSHTAAQLLQHTIVTRYCRNTLLQHTLLQDTTVSYSSTGVGEILQDLLIFSSDKIISMFGYFLVLVRN